MDELEEIIDIYDESRKYIGREKRSVVHREGFWHRSVDILVFSSKGNEKLLLIQKRSPNKATSPSTWDLSCAEHLIPGETYIDGAVRGLKEELGLIVNGQECQRLRDEYTYCLDDTERNIHDHEFKELFQLHIDDLFQVTSCSDECSDLFKFLGRWN